jgi:hypothetical protein
MKWMQKSLAVMMLALFSIAFAQACATSGKGEDDDDKPGFEKDYVKTSAGSPVFKPVQWGPDVRPPRLDARTNEGRQTKVNENIEGVKSRPETKTKYDKLTDRQKQCMAFHIAYLQAVMYQDIISPKAPAKVHADAKAVTDYYRTCSTTGAATAIPAWASTTSTSSTTWARPTPRTVWSGVCRTGMLPRNFSSRSCPSPRLRPVPFRNTSS